MTIGLADSMTYLFADYAMAVAAGVAALSVASVVIRLLWEFR